MEVVVTVISVALAGLATIAAFLLFSKGIRRGTIRTGLFNIDFERAAEQIRDHLPSVDAPPEDRQYALLREYHSRGLAQSTQSFWFSLITATFGFIVILSAVAVSAIQQASGQTSTTALPTIQLVSGVIIEAVSGLFFVQSNRARALMTQFFDRLREDRKLEESLILVDKMDPGPTKERVQAVLALSFSGSAPQDLIATVLSRNSPTTEQ